MTTRPRGFSLIEIGVVLGIVAILLAVSIPAYLRYRGHQVVNRALETTEGLILRAKEEAKSSGFALPDSLRQSGIAQAAPSGRQPSLGSLSLRLLKRFRAGEPAQVVTVRELNSGAALDYELSHLGVLDVEADPTLEGVYLELRDAGELRATIAIDTNAEFYLQGEQGNARLSFFYGDYRRSLELTRRGVIRPDGR